ncbi:family 10 glycosylhydrolase [Candidatus Sumerlaeota bacterium]|nr:family 10 glycosylhydrolase [Candidatus Sumerlaeota bacterium]
MNRKSLFPTCSLAALILILTSIPVFAQVSPSDQAQPEFRSLWITRFGWPSRDGNAEAIREKIKTIFSNMKEDGFNAVLFQVRGEADVLYPSKIEPWSRLIGGKDPGFDPLEFAILEAHKNGLEFHAYMNPFPLSSGRRDSKPESPDHLFFKHGPDTPESWVAMNEKGEPAFEEYFYLDPGIPQVQEYIRNVIMDVVRRYDVDGIHFDRIRYPGHAEYNPISMKRFQGIGNPGRRERGDWRRDQINKFVNDLYAEVVAEKPDVVMSAAVWGIYNRYHIEDYYNFSSGYHDYYQDSLEWVRLGAMDYLVPMIYWDMKDPKPNYQELIDDFADKSDIKHIIGGQRRFRGDENIAQIEYTRKKGAPGTCIFSGGRFPEFREGIYSKLASLPDRPWKTNPETGVILGTILDETGAPLVDAWVSISPADGKRSDNPVFRKKWTSGSDGRFAFLKVSPGSVKISAEYAGAPESATQVVEVEAGKVIKASVKIPNTKVARSQPFFEILNPEMGMKTSREVVHLLGRTIPENKVKVNGEDVEVFRTGAFAKDNIPLKMGENNISIEVVDPEGNAVSRVLTIERREGVEEAPGERRRRPRQDEGEPEAALRIVNPSENLILRPGDVLNIEVNAPAKLNAKAMLGEDLEIALNEKPGADGKKTGSYIASLRIPDNFSCPPTPLTFHISGKSEGEKYKIKQESRAKIEVWDNTVVKIAETKGDNPTFTWGLHSVRLGGPYINELPEGVRFEISGKQGKQFKARINGNITGWIHEDEVTILPDGTPPPHLFFTSLSVTGGDEDDIVTIPYSEKVVYTLSSDTTPSNLIYLDLFNCHYAMTWGSHKSTAKNVGSVKCEQVMDDWVRITIPVKSKQNWGFWEEIQDNALRIHVKRPPTVSPTMDKPFLGLIVAVEAGHGAEDSGAVGLMGTKEKTVNLMAATALQKELESRGAKVVQMRPGDSRPTFARRKQYAFDANADIMISLHANAGGSGRGYLRELGTSTYYKHEHSALLANILMEEMLSLGWGDFGCISSFNYNPLRTPRMPAVLIEQAFMNMPKEEARLCDPEYHREQAIAVTRGVERFLNYSGIISTGVVEKEKNLLSEKMNLKTAPMDIPEITREFRGVWVATVSRIDWPPEAGTEEQKQTLIDILDLAVEMNLNAIIFQVRPATDALYASELEPWSRWLTGEQGKAPDPLYDPLEFAVEEAHKRGLELHAWFNPYRAGTSASDQYADNHISKQHPELVRTQGRQLWLDPAEKGVQEHSLDVIMDVVNRYDIDAVHMDDYFYPYGASRGFDDEKTWEAYTSAGGDLSKEDWRRKNVDDFIQNLSRRIKRAKSHVKLGISPFGIWRPGYPEGVTGMDQYNTIYADPKKWLEEGWVDYLAPQLYWPIESKGQPFIPLLSWWREQNVKGRHIWPGLYTGKYSRDQIRRQVLESRKILGDTAGHIHFSQKTFRKDRGTTFVQTIYERPALVPEANWMRSRTPDEPKATVKSIGSDKVKIIVQPDSLINARQWVVQYLKDGEWDYRILPASVESVEIPTPDRAFVFSVNRLGASSRKTPLRL